MKQQIQTAVKNSRNLSEIKQALLKLFQEIQKNNPQKRIGYVAGILYSDGPEYFERNRQLLEKRTEYIRNSQKFPIFSAHDIFSNDVYAHLDERNFSQRETRDAFISFWREILSAGLVTDIFMTPRWEFSEGARDEYETAKKVGLAIHYYNEEK